MSKTHTIITIGRQFGSGGREIGKRLADELGIEFYDKELLSRAAKDSKICKELFETHDEKPTNSFLYSLVMDTYSMGFASGSVNEMPLNHKIFLAQFDAIKKIAEEGPCVLVGRCADYILKNDPYVISVFFYSDIEERIKWSIEEYQVPAKQAKKIVQEKDAQRARFYEFYTNQKWGNARNYTLMINTSKMSTDEAVQLLASFYDVKKGIPTFKNAFENQYEKNNTY